MLHTSGRLAVVLALVGAIGCSPPDDGRTADVRRDVASHTVAGVTVEVPGLDEAWATVLTYGAGRADDADTLRTAGLYGAGSGARVVVEATTSTPSFDRTRADALLASVTVDADELAAACH